MRRIRIKGVNDMKEYAFGIDLGGTTAKVGLFTTSGKLLEKWEVRTDTSNNGAHILENLAAAVQQKMQEKGLSADEVEGVGLGVPGPVLDSSIVPIGCANLGGWGNRNVSIELRELLGGIRVLGGKVRELATCPVPGTDVTHRAVVIEKVKPTPARFPRRWAKIQKEPIR